MNDKLDIGAALRQRREASERQGPGESAWAVPELRMKTDASTDGTTTGNAPLTGQGQPIAPAGEDQAPQADAAPAQYSAQASALGAAPHSSAGITAQREEPGINAGWTSSPSAEPSPRLDPWQGKGRSTGSKGTDSGEPPALLPPLPSYEDEDNGPGELNFDILRFARGLWIRKWLIASITLIVMFFFLAIALSLPREWRATVTMIKQDDQAPLQVTASRPFQTQSYQLQTFIDTIKLPTSLDETMARAGISVMRRTLASAIEVWDDDNSTVFSIHVTWDEPEMAARLANIVSELFLENSREIRLGNLRNQFNEYKTQLEEARTEFQRINDKLIAYAEEYKIASLDTQISALVNLVTQVEASYNTNISKAEALRAAKARIQEQYQAEPEMIIASSLYRSPLKQRLSDYQWELQEARTRYTERNPKIVRLKHRIETLEQLIADSGDEVAPENVYEINPKRGELFLRKQETENQLEVADAEANAQRETLDESRAELSRLLAARAGWQELNAESTDSARLVDSLAARLSEVRVAMQQVNSGFSILEQAEPPDLPEPSLRKLVAAAGVVLGSGLAIFIALLLELLDPFVRTARDAQGITGCPLIFEFEETPEGQRCNIDVANATSPVATLFRRFANDLRSILEPDEWKQLAIISAEPRAGRTLIASNLAAALGQQERDVLVVDADMRITAGPRPARLLGARRPEGASEIHSLGLADLLADRCGLDQAVIETDHPWVRLISRGTETEADNDGDDEESIDLLKLGSRAFAAFNQRMSMEPFPVFYDLPPIAETEAVAEASATIEHCLLVVRSEQTKRSDLKVVADRLSARGISIRAVLITMIPPVLLTRPSVFGPKFNGTWLDRLLVSRLTEYRTRATTP